MLVALRHRDFRLLVAGMVISQTGDWLYNVALLIFVLDRTHSGAWVAAAGIVRLVPYVVFGTFGGVIADRYDRKTVMIVSDLARAGIMAELGPPKGESRAADEHPIPLRERLAEGMRALASSSDAILVVGVWVIGGFTYGQEIVLYALVAGQRLGMGENGLGFLYASLGVGGILAASLASRAATRPRQGPTLVIA